MLVLVYFNLFKIGDKICVIVNFAQFDFCSVASMRLAYKELEIDRKMEEKKLQNLEGKKRQQAERLGMGFGNRR